MHKILCLHGLTQNSSIFTSKRIAKLQKRLKNKCHFISIDAPYCLENNEEERTWWEYGSACNSNMSSFTNLIYNKNKYKAIGIEKTINYLIKEWESGDYDGLLGFSQGSLMATVLLPYIDPKFIILVSGFCTPGFSNIEISNEINVPSLHIWGSNDLFVQPDLSKQLKELFKDPQYFIHTGAHFIPQDQQSADEISKFLENEILIKKNE